MSDEQFRPPGQGVLVGPTCSRGVTTWILQGQNIKFEPHLGVFGFGGFRVFRRTLSFKLPSPNASEGEERSVRQLAMMKIMALVLRLRVYINSRV